MERAKGMAQFPVFQHSDNIERLRKIKKETVNNLRDIVGEDTEDALLGQVIALHMSAVFLYPKVSTHHQGEFRRCLGQLPEIMTQSGLGRGAIEEGATAALLDLLSTLDILGL